MLEEFQWEGEWVDENCEPLHEGGVDDWNWLMWMRLLMLLKGYWDATLPRAAVARATACQTNLGKGSVQGTHQGTIWLKKNDSDERDQAQHHLEESDSATMEEDDSYGPPQDRNEEDFHLNDDLLFRSCLCHCIARPSSCKLLFSTLRLHCWT